MTESLLATFQQWLLFSGAVLAVGCVAWRLIVVPRASDLVSAPRFPAIERAVATLGVLAGTVALVAWVLRMVVQVRGFRDPFVPLWEDVSFLLFETTWGSVWMAQGVVLPLLIGAFAWARAGSRAAWRAAMAFALGLVATLSLSSHAMGAESARAFYLTADAIHALAAGCWIGSLAVIVTAGRPSDSSDESLAFFAAQLRAFSPVAIVSVSALIAMGAVLAWTYIVALPNLWLTGYGRVLMAKVSLAVLVFLAGLINWRRGLAVLDTTDGSTTVRRRAALEVGAAVGVLLLTAVLVHSVKP
ncbi:MAG: CopD family protein [Longimicrobiales bacterium]